MKGEGGMVVGLGEDKRKNLRLKREREIGGNYYLVESQRKKL